MKTDRHILTTLLALLTAVALPAQTFMPDTLLYVYSLYGQTRKYECSFSPNDGGIKLDWLMTKSGAQFSGSFVMTGKALQSADKLSFAQPAPGQVVTLSDQETFGLLSAAALQTLKDDGAVTCSGVTYNLVDDASKAMGLRLLHVRDSYEGGEMWVLDCPSLPVIWKMQGNPLGINWTVEPCSALTRGAYASPAGDLKAWIMSSPQQMGSIYYAYPAPSGVRTAVPDGYEPVYISHYGRHGSRWMANDSKYRQVIDVFDSIAAAGGLTDLGKDVYARLGRVWENAEGMGGQLSPVGWQQHHDIARRMYESFPSVFEGDGGVNAVASVYPRCIMSMASFCESLREHCPGLVITRATGDRYMRYIAWSSEESKLHDSPRAPWYADYLDFCGRQIRPARLMSLLFTDPDALPAPGDMMMGLFWIASDMQDVTAGESFYDLFTAEELFDIWQTINYRMYICNAESPVGNCSGPRSAKSLLDDVITKADAALANGTPAADLRFGHDTNLIRLLARMSVVGCNNAESDPSNYWQAWQDFRVSPMAANLQIIFYRNAQGHVLVKLLHNEEEARLPIESAVAPYYDWEAVKQLWAKEY